MSTLRPPSGADVVVVGSGVAGLAAALGLRDRRVLLLTRGGLGRGGSSPWAQGGVAVAMGPGDAPALHARDTLAVAGGIADPRAVDTLVHEGPAAIVRAIEVGTAFDRTPDGALSFGREAAHSRRRILHAGGDATGAELVRALVAAVEAAPWVRVEDATATDLLVDDGRVVGLLGRAPDGSLRAWSAGAVVLATGGIGQLWLHTTNPAECTGAGLAMAARAGARLADLEFVQFHPTALLVDEDPLPLLTEALRGEGATLIDGAGRRFMPAEHPLAELAPRDVVARAIWRRRRDGGEVFLDAREAVGERFPERFPTVYASCIRHGIDPRCEPIPVTPAAHYHMGGVATDLDGRTSLPGLWACGEVASTGVHGANRLASNSLLEGLVFAERVARDVAAERGARPESRAVFDLARRHAAQGLVPAAPDPEWRRRLRTLLWREVGLVRSEAGLRAAAAALDGLAKEPSAATVDGAAQLVAARAVTAAALLRPESRGAHVREDAPGSRPELAVRSTWTWAELDEALRETSPASVGAARR